MADNTKLARLIAGIPSNPFAVPFTGLRNEPAPPAFAAPFTGLRNEAAAPGPQLPIQDPAALGPYSMPMGTQMPSHGLPSFNRPPLMPPASAPSAPTPMPQQAAPQALPPLDVGGQGFGSPEPAPGTIPPAYDANMDQRYLPEQWRGAFTQRG